MNFLLSFFLYFGFIIAWRKKYASNFSFFGQNTNSEMLEYIDINMKYEFNNAELEYD